MEINSVKDFDQKVLQQKGTVLVDFYADWCGPCRSLAKNLALIEDQINIVKVNVDNLPELADQYGVQGIPMVFLFKDGELNNQFTGLKSKEQLLQFIA